MCTSRAVIAAVLFGSLAFSAYAQSEAELERKLDRLDARLERIEQGSQASALPAPVSGAQAARYEVAISELEANQRHLNGQIEQLSYQIQQLQQSHQQFMKEMDLRLQQMEQAGVGAPPSFPDTSPQPRPNAFPGFEDRPDQQPRRPVLNDTPPPTEPVQSFPAFDDDAAEQEEMPASAEQPSDANSTEVIQEAYNQAFKTLNAGDYAGAAAMFQRFIRNHPKSHLIGNAHYWLGESFYVRNDFAEASEEFRRGFQNQPDGPKAPDNLLKLAMSLHYLDRTDESCIVLHQLLTKYAEQSKAVARKARKEHQKLQCK